MKKILLAFALVAGAILTAHSQGITTSALNGVVTDQKGETLPGATVIATHKPTGTEYGVVTNENGKFYFPNVRVGGPYSLSITFVGFRTHQESDFNLALGENRN